MAVRRRLRALAWALCVLTVVTLVAAVVLAIADPASGGPATVRPSGPTLHDRAESGGYVALTVLEAIAFGSFALVGGAVAARRPRRASALARRSASRSVRSRSASPRRRS